MRLILAPLAKPRRQPWHKETVFLLSTIGWLLLTACGFLSVRHWHCSQLVWGYLVVGFGYPAAVAYKYIVTHKKIREILLEGNGERLTSEQQYHVLGMMTTILNIYMTALPTTVCLWFVLGFVRELCAP